MGKYRIMRCKLGKERCGGGGDEQGLQWEIEEEGGKIGGEKERRSTQEERLRSNRGAGCRLLVVVV